MLFVPQFNPRACTMNGLNEWPGAPLFPGGLWEIQWVDIISWLMISNNLQLFKISVTKYFTRGNLSCFGVRGHSPSQRRRHGGWSVGLLAHIWMGQKAERHGCWCWLSSWCCLSLGPRPWDAAAHIQAKSSCLNLSGNIDILTDIPVVFLMNDLCDR